MSEQNKPVGLDEELERTVPYLEHGPLSSHATPATAELVEGPLQLTKLNLDTPEFRALSAALSPEQRETLAVYIRTRAHGYARDAIASDRASRDQQPAVAQGVKLSPHGYVNFETLDYVVAFGGDKVPDGYYPVTILTDDLRAQLARQSQGEQFKKFDLTDYSVAVNYSNGTSTPVLPAAPQPAPARFGESVGDDEVPLPRAINEVHFANGAPQHFMEYTAGQAVYSTEQMRQYARTYHAHMMRKLGGEAGSIDTLDFQCLLAHYADERAKGMASESFIVARTDIIAHIDAKLAQARADTALLERKLKAARTVSDENFDTILTLRAELGEVRAGGSVEGKPNDWIESKGRRSNRGGRYWHVREKDDLTDDCIVDSFFTEDEAKQFCAAHPDHEYFNWID